MRPSRVRIFNQRNKKKICKFHRNRDESMTEGHTQGSQFALKRNLHRRFVNLNNCMNFDGTSSISNRL